MMQDKITNIIAKHVANNFLGDLDTKVPGGVLRGTSMSNNGDKHVLHIGLFQEDVETGEIEDRPVSSWTLTLDKTD